MPYNTSKWFTDPVLQAQFRARDAEDAADVAAMPTPTNYNSSSSNTISNQTSNSTYNSLSGSVTPSVSNIPIPKVGNYDNINYDPSVALAGLGRQAGVTTDTSESQSIIDARQGLANRTGVIDILGKTKVTPESITAANALRGDKYTQYDTNVKESIGLMKDYTTGTAKADRTAANIALGRFEATNAAAMKSQAQRLATNPYLSEGAKQAAAAEAGRLAGSARATLTGELAQKAQERAFTATEKYGQMALDAAKFDEQRYTTDLKTVTDDIQRELDANVAAGNIEQGLLNNATSIWATKISAIQQDNSNAIQALMGLDKINYQQAEFMMEKENKKVEDSFKLYSAQLDGIRTENNTKEVTSAITLANQTIAKNYTTASTGAIMKFKDNHPKDPKMTNTQYIDSLLGDPNFNSVMLSLSSEWKALGNDGPPSDIWLKSRLEESVTADEAIQNNITRLRNTYVGQDSQGNALPGKMNEDTFNQVSGFLTMAKDLGPGFSINSDGSVTLTQPDGSKKIFTKSGIKDEPNTIAKEKSSHPIDWVGVNDNGILVKVNAQGYEESYKTTDNKPIIRDGKEYRLNSNGEYVEYDLWGEENTKAIKNGTSDPSVIIDRANFIIKNNAYDKLKGLSDNDPVVQEVTKQIPPVTFDIQRYKSSLTNKVVEFSNFERALTNKTPINFNGKIYYVSSKEVLPLSMGRTFASSPTIYTLTDLNGNSIEYGTKN